MIIGLVLLKLSFIRATAVHVVVPGVVPQVVPVAQVNSTLASDCGESRFVVEPCAKLMADAARRFEDINAQEAWGSRKQELGTHTKSGLGSDMMGAFDWITGLTKFFNQNPELQPIADIPSGDMGWQMAVRHLNTAKLYFGGDIAKTVAEDNAKRYQAHENKILQHWDLFSCGVPKWSTTCNSTKNSFDVIMIRDAFIHIPINKVQQILRKVILNSGAKWFITNSHPANDTDTLGTDPYGCSTNENLFCRTGAISEGDWYPIALDCAPFRLPSPAFKTASHSTFKIENAPWTRFKLSGDFFFCRKLMASNLLGLDCWLKMIGLRFFLTDMNARNVTFFCCTPKRQQTGTTLGSPLRIFCISTRLTMH